MGWHNSIAFTVARALQHALTPRYGGEIVEQITLVDSAEAPHEYRWADGYVIEVTRFAAIISRIDTPHIVHRPIDIEDISRAGESWADETEIRRRTELDLEAKPPTVVEIDNALSRAETLGNLLTGAARRSYEAVAGREDDTERFLTPAEVDRLELVYEAGQPAAEAV